LGHRVEFHQNKLELSSNIAVIILIVSVALVVVLMVLFALHLHREKKREGISYQRAIAIINDHIAETYGDKRGAKKQFCEDEDINYRNLTRAINTDNPTKMPDLVADTLNKIGFEVSLENKSIYLKKS